MRIWRGLLALISIVAVLAVAAGCSSGGPVEQKEDYSNFTRVNVQGAFDVQVQKASSFAVTVTVAKAYVDFLSVSQAGDTLTIKLLPRQPFTDFTLVKDTLKADISMPALLGLSLSGASQGTVSGFESTDDLAINVSGASSVRVDSIKTGNGDFQVSGASKLTGNLAMAALKVDISGASHLDLAGSGDSATCTGSGASQINLQNFISKTASVNLDGATQATVDATDNLDCVLSGASSLVFLDNPSIGTLNITGASTVKQK